MTYLTPENIVKNKWDQGLEGVGNNIFCENLKIGPIA
jgi:hypothetical protein